MRDKYLIRSKEVGDEIAYGIRWCSKTKELMIAGPKSELLLFEQVGFAFGRQLKTAERTVYWSWRIRAEWSEVTQQEFNDGITTLREEWYVDKVRAFRRLTR